MEEFTSLKRAVGSRVVVHTLEEADAVAELSIPFAGAASAPVPIEQIQITAAAAISTTSSIEDWESPEFQIVRAQPAAQSSGAQDVDARTSQNFGADYAPQESNAADDAGRESVNLNMSEAIHVLEQLEADLGIGPGSRVDPRAGSGARRSGTDGLDNEDAGAMHAGTVAAAYDADASRPLLLVDMSAFLASVQEGDGDGRTRGAGAAAEEEQAEVSALLPLIWRTLTGAHATASASASTSSHSHASLASVPAAALRRMTASWIPESPALCVLLSTQTGAAPARSASASGAGVASTIIGQTVALGGAGTADVDAEAWSEACAALVQAGMGRHSSSESVRADVKAWQQQHQQQAHGRRRQWYAVFPYPASLSGRAVAALWADVQGQWDGDGVGAHDAAVVAVDALRAEIEGCQRDAALKYALWRRVRGFAAAALADAAAAAADRTSSSGSGVWHWSQHSASELAANALVIVLAHILDGVTGSIEEQDGWEGGDSDAPAAPAPSPEQLLAARALHIAAGGHAAYGPAAAWCNTAAPSAVELLELWWDAFRSLPTRCVPPPPLPLLAVPEEAEGQDGDAQDGEVRIEPPPAPAEEQLDGEDDAEQEYTRSFNTGGPSDADIAAGRLMVAAPRLGAGTSALLRGFDDPAAAAAAAAEQNGAAGEGDEDAEEDAAAAAALEAATAAFRMLSQLSGGGTGAGAGARSGGTRGGTDAWDDDTPATEEQGEGEGDGEGEEEVDWMAVMAGYAPVPGARSSSGRGGTRRGGSSRGSRGMTRAQALQDQQAEEADDEGDADAPAAPVSTGPLSLAARLRARAAASASASSGAAAAASAARGGMPDLRPHGAAGFGRKAAATAAPAPAPAPAPTSGSPDSASKKSKSSKRK